MGGSDAIGHLVRYPSPLHRRLTHSHQCPLPTTLGAAVQAQPRPGKAARKGDFPHVYSCWGKEGRRITWWCLKACMKLPLGPDGERVFPAGCFSDEIDE